MTEQPDTTADQATAACTKKPRLLQEIAQRAAELHPETIDAHPNPETLDYYDPDAKRTGRVHCWLTRSDDGGIIMGSICLPGTYSVITCPTDRDPHALIGTEVTATPVGWFHSSGNMNLNHTIPDTPDTSSS